MDTFSYSLARRIDRGTTTLNKRRIGFLEAFTIGVGGMIGGGIFAVLGLSVSLTRYAAPLAFLISGLVALLTGYSYAKLSTRYPSRGGTIEFLVKAFGTGILAGGLNILLFISYTVMIALYAFAFGHYTAAGFGLNEHLAQFFSLLVIIVFVVVNAFGAFVSGKVEDMLVMVKLGILILVAGTGFLFVKFLRLSPSNWPGMGDIIAGGMIIFLAYEGFELISNAAQDVYDHRVIPKALYASILTTLSVYILIAIVTVGVLPLSEVIKAKDYALAIVAKPALGNIGFWLVVIGALLSTSSAINATLYGTAGITYLISKMGYLPKELGKHLWKEATEGLIIIAIISSIFVLKAPLEIISAAGSAGFLTIFMAVNVSAFRLRNEIKANGVITIVATVLSAIALIFLLYNQIVTTPIGVLTFLVLFLSSFLVEYLIRRISGRELRHHVDERLENREGLLRGWKEWLPTIIKELEASLKKAEIYLIGSYARGELGHDIDLLIVEKGSRRNIKEILDVLEDILRRKGLYVSHPLHIHYIEEKDLKEYKRRSKKLVKLTSDRRNNL